MNSVFRCAFCFSLGSSLTLLLPQPGPALPCPGAPRQELPLSWALRPLPFVLISVPCSALVRELLLPPPHCTSFVSWTEWRHWVSWGPRWSRGAEGHVGLAGTWASTGSTIPHLRPNLREPCDPLSHCGPTSSVLLLSPCVIVFRSPPSAVVASFPEARPEGQSRERREVGQPRRCRAPWSCPTADNSIKTSVLALLRLRFLLLKDKAN